MKKAVWIAILFLFQGGMLLKGNASQDELIRLGKLLPKEVDGWKAQEKDRLYDPETIFDYIDGAGEVYRSYNFRHLLVRRYTKAGKPDIVADIFDMGTSKDAFGVFTHDLEGEDAGVGQGATYQGGLLSFWKDRFFVSLYAEEESEETRGVLLAMGSKVEASIDGEGEKPVILAYFPSEKLNEKSIRFFHNHIILNYHFFVADQNILLLNQETEAALGMYEEGNIRLLIIRYPQQQKASDAYESFMRHYMPDAQQEGLTQIEDGLWTGVRVKGELLFLVFDAPSASHARGMMEEVEKRIEEKRSNT